MPGSIIPHERIQGWIHCLRGEKVMLSPQLAALYGVEPRVLIQAVKRNLSRFPDDFMFQLSPEEWKDLKSQLVISSWGGARRAAPFAFTEQGIAMLSGILNSPRAIHVNIEIMRTFVRLRQFMISHADLARKLAEIEEKYDLQFKAVFAALRQLISPPEPRKKEIGFRVREGKADYGKKHRGHSNSPKT